MIAAKGKGKRGGGRVIYFIVQSNGQIILCDIYDKSDFDTIDEKLLIDIINEEGFNV
jgi:hypothetical protein